MNRNAEKITTESCSKLESSQQPVESNSSEKTCVENETLKSENNSSEQATKEDETPKPESNDSEDAFIEDEAPKPESNDSENETLKSESNDNYVIENNETPTLASYQQPNQTNCSESVSIENETPNSESNSGRNVTLKNRPSRGKHLVLKEDVPCSSVAKNKIYKSAKGLKRKSEGTIGRRKQVTPKKINVSHYNEAENTELDHQNASDKTKSPADPSLLQKGSTNGDEDVTPDNVSPEYPGDHDEAEVAVSSNIKKPPKKSKSAGKQGNLPGMDSILDDNATNAVKITTRKPGPKKKISTPKKVPASKKRISPTKSRTPRKPKAKALMKSPSIQDEKSELNENTVNVNEDKETPDENNDKISNGQPALSLKIICTPFSQKHSGDSSTNNKNIQVPVQNKSKGKKTTPVKRASKSPRAQKSKKIVAVDEGMGVATPSQEEQTEKAMKGNKGTKRKYTRRKVSSNEKSNQLSPSPEVGSDKRTRGRRKKKITTEEFIEDFMTDSESDIALDSSEDEYVPPKDEDKLSPTNKGSAKKKRKVSFATVEEKMKSESIKQESTQASDVKPTKAAVKKTKAKPLGSKAKAEPKVQQKRPVKNKSPRKRNVKNKKEISQKELDKEEKELEKGDLDMPTISPNKGKASKRKKRRRVLSPKKTYLDNIKDYTGRREDFSDFTATEGEEDQTTTTVKKKRRKRRAYGHPYSVTGTWYIAQGYLFDITSLLESFEKIESWRFRDFSRCWQRLNFSLVYRGRQNFKELLEFSEEIALLTKRFMMPPHTMKFRIGALYTIYGLYYKHPFKHFFKIRLVREEYEKLLLLVKPFRTNLSNPDPAYIFRKLEVCGAISHVASSLEMCIDFYCAEREAVDINYESQRLASTSAVVAALPSESLDVDDKLLKQYHNIKTKILGDGKDPEKAVSFVEPTTAMEITQQLTELKEETLQILRLKEPPPTVKTSLQDNELSAIGTRRAEIMAKAAKSDTGTDYLKNKCFRENMNIIPLKGKSGRTVVKRLQRFTRDRESSENESSLSYTDLQYFMKPPTKDVLNTPLKIQRRSPRKTPHKFIKKHAHEEDVQVMGEEVDGDLSLEHVGESASNSSLREDDSPQKDAMCDILKELNVVPQVSPPPKRYRGRARKIALHEALEKPPHANALADVQALRKKMRAKEMIEKMLKTQKRKPGVSSGSVPKTEVPVASVSKVEVPFTPVIELPSEETSIILPIKREVCNPRDYEDEGFRETGVQSETILVDNESEMKPWENHVGEDNFITLNIHFTGENVNEVHHFKISARHWKSIQNNHQKLDALKRKLLTAILPADIRCSLEQGKEIDVNISLLDSRNQGSMAVPEMDFMSQGTNQLNQSQMLQMNNSCVSSGLQPLLVTPKKEMPDIVTPPKSRPLPIDYQDKSGNAVIRELHEIWCPDEEEGAYEIKPVGEGFDVESQRTFEERRFEIQDSQVPILKEIPTDNYMNNSEVLCMADDDSDVNKSDIDVDDFEDESEPIILTPQGVGNSSFLARSSPFADSFVSSVDSPNHMHNIATSIGPHRGNLSSIQSTTEPTIPVMPLYRRLNQIPVSLPQGLRIQTPNTRPLLYSSSPVVTSVSPNARTPIYPVVCQPSQNLFRNVPSLQRDSLLHNSHAVISQPSISEHLHPHKFPGSVSVSHLPPGSIPPRGNRPSGTLTPVALPHHPGQDSLEGLRHLPNTGGSKFVKVKINDQSLFVPADRILTKASKINYVSEMRETGSSPSETNHQQQQQKLAKALVESEVESVESKLDTPRLDILRSNSSVSVVSVPVSKSKQGGVAECEDSRSSSVSSDFKKSTPVLAKQTNRVCSFLFSSKYKALSGMMKDSAVGKATGTPVLPKKNNVPFIFKHSLVPKKKSI